MGSSKKLDLEKEIEPESDTILDGMDDLDDVDDLDDLSLDEDSSGNQVLQSTSKRVRMIFSVMASPNRIDILRILNSKGPLTYSELKSLAGFQIKERKWQICISFKKIVKAITCGTKQVRTKIHNYKSWQTCLKPCKAD